MTHRHTTNLLIAVATLFGFSNFVHAADINYPGFSGSINTTVTSGFTVRASSRDCMRQDGYTLTASAADMSNITDALAVSGSWSNSQVAGSVTSADQILVSRNKNAEFSASCAKYQQDDYGNLSTNVIEYGNVNSDNGNLNYNEGDVVDATQSVYSKISGYTDSGIGLNLSFIGSYNPTNDISAPIFMKLTSNAQQSFEQDLTLLDAYMTNSFDVGDNYVDITAGRFVTSWGEGTFVPIGMNGLVSNALDLTKLRAPGSSIRDALVPTEQISFATDIEGWGIDAYYQLSESHITVDPKGTFYGSDVAGEGATSLLASGANNNETYNEYCSAVSALYEGRICNAETAARHTALDTRATYDTSQLNRSGLIAADADVWATYTAAAANAVDGSPSAALANIPLLNGVSRLTAFGTTQFVQKMAAAGINPASDTAADDFAALDADVQAGHETTGTNAALLEHAGLGGTFMSTQITGGLNTNGFVSSAAEAGAVWTEANIPVYNFDQMATVDIKRAAELHKYARNDGQFGLSAHKYFDNIGTGLDLGLYYSNYHSKVPYIQIIGKGGMLAGDIVGAYTSQVGSGTAGLTGIVGRTMAGGTGLGQLSRLCPTNLTLIQCNGGTTLGADAIDNLNGLGYVAGSSEDLIAQALLNGGIGAVGIGVATALGASATLGVAAADTNQTFNEAYKNFNHRVLVNGNLLLDPNSMAVGAQAADRLTGDPLAAAQQNAGLFIKMTPALAAAVTPLNYAQYQFIYPEDIQVFGASFNTNIGATTLQGEVTYRPDMPLAHSAGDQINQLSDAAGVTNALVLAQYAGAQLDATGAKAQRMAEFQSAVESVTGAGTFQTLLQATSRSSLRALTSTGSAGVDYRTDAFINKDVFTGSIGTTTSFAPSHPLTAGLGADASVLVTELAGVNIRQLNNMVDGFIARNGFNEGSGEHLCLGMFSRTDSATISSINAVLLAREITDNNGDQMAIDYNLSDGAQTAVGASITDGVFGNGSYCESQMGADTTSMTYRVIGAATYNNVGNTPWSLRPSFAWSHDFMGYGPSSLGGFVEGKQALSLGVTASKGEGLSVGLNYVNQMGDEKANGRGDMDTISANVSYAF